MATGPCQAGFAGTHYYIYLRGRGEGGEVPPYDFWKVFRSDLAVGQCTLLWPYLVLKISCSFRLNLFKTPISRQDWPMILRLFLCYLLLFLNSWTNGTKGDPAIHQPITALTMSLQRLELEPERVQPQSSLICTAHMCRSNNFVPGDESG
jgi:hypothetical protein